MALLLTGFVTNAQNRCFKAYDRLGREVTKFCVGERITFRDCGGVDADKEYYDYDKADDKEDKDGDGKPDGPVYDSKKYFTYTKPGSVTVTQYGNLKGNQGAFEQTFEVVATPDPTFTTIACANNNFTVNLNDSNYDFYIIRFLNDKNQSEYSPTVFKNAIANPIKHKYTGVPKEITVTGGYVGAFCSSIPVRQTISNLPAYMPPVISQLIVQVQDATTGAIRLTIDGLQPAYNYTLERKDGTSFQAVRTVGATENTLTLTTLDTTVPLQFRITATDACSQALAPSNTVTSIPVTPGDGNEQATIDWSSIAGTFRQFEIYRNGTLLQTIAGNQNQFIDEAVSCAQEYCYEVRGIAADGKSVSQSAGSCIRVISSATPPAPTLLATFNLQNEVELTLQLPDGQGLKTATYLRSMNGAPFTKLQETQQLTLTDQLQKTGPVCYRASFVNLCDKTSVESAPACPVILTVKQNPDETVLLTWTNYSGFTGGVANYSLELLDESGNLISSTPVRGNRHTTQLADQQEQIFRYRIKAIATTGEVTYSNNETIKLEYALFVPSGFTPNGDGLNDLFEVKGKRFENFAIKVMNSAGQVVYTGADRTTGWDGNYNGKPQPAGVYAYEVTITLQDGTTKRRTGTVTLIR
ncbi:gliding motility-associated C-terminal domain-containing protein [Pontibacter burrus]|uniref:Gliding motility-associated C-terminal domain-containing protein n=1 Tax=Pontibacter burrus TaxID=2704466 RepID=A0A6B3LU03_9BACT|nr:gliding motility-associated C-terminal domain-containing protein [Pontibacter burrus]NEM97478.1 gliding motility-associated C-terminal domain-containing protein [Pontibacter burrus]